MATIVYALFGIPLVLTILNDWGMLLFNFLLYLYCQYTRFKCRRSAWEPVDQDQNQQSDAQQELPVSVAVFLLIFWLCTCAAIFLIWEDDWNYFTSFYFFFISLTTIGLGEQGTLKLSVLSAFDIPIPTCRCLIGIILYAKQYISSKDLLE